MENLYIININNFDVIKIPIGIKEFDNKFNIYDKIGEYYYIQIEIMDYLPRHFNNESINNFNNYLTGKFKADYFILLEIDDNVKECYKLLLNSAGNGYYSNTLFYSMSDYSNLTILKLKVEEANDQIDSILNMDKSIYRTKQINSIFED